MEFKKTVCPECGSDNLESNALREEITCLNCGGVFTKKPELKVFFSYGHDDHADFVRALADAVEKRSGYAIDVWIDHVKLREGSEWRSKIIEGINNSNGVLAFLSKYSARERGVCLDELTIAISSKHGIIRSVLLQELDKDGNFIPVEDKPTAPPAMASAYQWADMSDYKEHKDDFDNYVNEKADEIIKMLSSDEIREYNSDLKLLRSKLVLPQPQRDWKFEYMLNQKDYVDREWLKEKVEDWLADENSKKILILYGAPGSGKSMFSAHLQHYNPAVAAAFACEYNSNEFSDTDNIISWLAYKLAMRIPYFRGNLLRQYEDESFDPGKGKDRFDRLIIAPLYDCIDGGHAKMMIVIDAIDEVKTGAFRKFIKDCTGMLPPWLKIFITARPEPEILQCFEEYSKEFFEDYKLANDAELKEYFAKRLSAALAGRDGIDEFYSRLVEASEGIFAYAEKVCDNILADLKEDPGKKLGDYPLPKGLYGLFEDTLDRQFEDRISEYEDFWQTPLGMIIASPEPLPVETLKQLMGWRDNAFKKFYAPLSAMLRRENGCLAAFHRSFAEWLDATEGKYHASREDGVFELAKKSYALYKEGVDELDEFTLTHLTGLLREAKMKKEYARVAADDKFFDRMFEVEEKLCNDSLFAEAIAICEEIVRTTKDSDDESGLSIAATALQNIGIIRKEINDFSGACDVLAKVAECIEKLIKICPAGLYEWHLAENYIFTAQIYKEKNERDGAIEWCEKALEIARNASKKSQDTNTLWGLINTLCEAEDIYDSFRKHADADMIRKEIVNTCERFLEADPTNDDCKYYLASALSRIADNCGDEDPAAAYELYMKAVSIRKEILAAEPHKLDNVDRLTRAIRDAARALEDLKIQSKAAELYAEAKSIDEKFKIPDDDADDARSVTSDQNKREEYENELQAARQLVNAYPQNPKYKLDLIELLESGWVKSYLDDLLEPIEILRGLVKDYPENPEYKNNLAKLLKYMGAVYSETDDESGVIDSDEESLCVFRELVAQHPEDIGYNEQLADCLRNTALYYLTRGEGYYGVAIEYLYEALGIRRRLIDDYPGEEYLKYELANLIEKTVDELELLLEDPSLLIWFENSWLEEGEDEAESGAFENTIPKVKELTEEELSIRRKLFELDKAAQEYKSNSASELEQELKSDDRQSRRFSAFNNPLDIFDHNIIRLADLLKKAAETETDQEERIKLWEEELDIRLRILADRYGHVNPDFNRRLTDLIGELKWVYSIQKNDTKAAMKLMKTELDVLRQLVSEFPQNGSYVEELVDTLSEIAQSRVLDNETTDVVELCKEALGILRQLKYKHPLAEIKVEEIADTYYRLWQITGNAEHSALALETAQIFPNRLKCRYIIRQLGGE